ncbi:hypothetical protein C5E26_12990 [Pectobacterium parmentieri]|nr:hypothetical protein C5E26_12990 [Pectobacterium parmentieri]AYH23564.1 hypothetical protein C5E21_12120 [Pectobacterium parmentieri]AYH28045.1 hypothetical protein C5E20_13395 [Pectobacterium parmentieri]
MFPKNDAIFCKNVIYRYLEKSVPSIEEYIVSQNTSKGTSSSHPQQGGNWPSTTGNPSGGNRGNAPSSSGGNSGKTGGGSGKSGK